MIYKSKHVNSTEQITFDLPGKFSAMTCIKENLIAVTYGKGFMSIYDT